MDTETENEQLTQDEAAAKEIKKDKLVVPSKTTLNLCMKEKSTVSPALFVSILALILILAAVIGYFGVYRPYQSVKERQAALDEARAKLQQTYDRINDYNNKYKDEDGKGGIETEYNRYNYEGFDKTIADRLDVLAILEKDIFPVATVNTISINNKTVSLTISGISSKELADLIVKLSENELVATVRAYRGSDMDDGTDEEGVYSSSVSMTITLNDANEEAD